MPPKPRSLSKQCDECGVGNPVACKSCTACGADFYSGSTDKIDSPDEPASEIGSDTPGTPGSERRRSERVRREKPDYYDALEFETKRRDKQNAGQVMRSVNKRVDKERLHRGHRVGKDGVVHHEERRGRPRKQGRAHLTWKKGRNPSSVVAANDGEDDDDDDEDEDEDDYDDGEDGSRPRSAKKKRKQAKHHRNNDKEKEAASSPSAAAGGMIRDGQDLDDESSFMDDLAPEKSLQCRVSLAEINRKLGIVMYQPVLL